MVHPSEDELFMLHVSYLVNSCFAVLILYLMCEVYAQAGVYSLAKSGFP